MLDGVITIDSVDAWQALMAQARLPAQEIHLAISENSGWDRARLDITHDGVILRPAPGAAPLRGDFYLHVAADDVTVTGFTFEHVTGERFSYDRPGIVMDIAGDGAALLGNRFVANGPEDSDEDWRGLVMVRNTAQGFTARNNVFIGSNAMEGIVLGSTAGQAWQYGDEVAAGFRIENNTFRDSRALINGFQIGQHENDGDDRYDGMIAANLVENGGRFETFPVKGSAVTLHGNHVYGSAPFNLRLGHDNTVTDNVIRGANDNGGIHVTGTGHLLRGNTIDGSECGGIHLKFGQPEGDFSTYYPINRANRIENNTIIFGDQHNPACGAFVFRSDNGGHIVPADNAFIGNIIHMPSDGRAVSTVNVDPALALDTIVGANRWQGNQRAEPQEAAVQ